jgi:anaerobic magnesium-protoporphyrin IX monomethyl ester cyclase
MAKILLLNPPGTQTYLRDYYCSKVAKADYLYEPTDLLLLSGRLAEAYEVEVLDCIAMGMKEQEALQYIRVSLPDVVVFLSGAVSWHEDRVFLEEVKRLSRAVLVGSGDLFLENGVQLLEGHEFVDAILLDFTTSDILDYLEQNTENQHQNMIYRQNGGIVQGPLKRARNSIFEIPPPRHDLFPHHRYNYPTVKRPPFATVLTDYGCPYHCRFCVMGKLGYKVRPVENVLGELETLANMGFREIYFNDQSFGALRERTLTLCEGMNEKQLRFGWQAWTRVDLVDEQLLKMMQAAGCHTLLFGVESANEDTLKSQNKGYNPAKVRRAFSLCRQLGIRTMATFIIGLPGENEVDIRNTIRFALELDPDYASFNVLVPRAATDTRKEAVEKGWIQEGHVSLDQSGTFPIMGNEFLTAADVWRLKNEAIRKFYGRPSYWWRRLRNVTTSYELRRNLINGWALLSKMGAQRTG